MMIHKNTPSVDEALNTQLNEQVPKVVKLTNKQPIVTPLSAKMCGFFGSFFCLTSIEQKIDQVIIYLFLSIFLFHKFFFEYLKK